MSAEDKERDKKENSESMGCLIILIGIAILYGFIHAMFTTTTTTSSYSPKKSYQEQQYNDIKELSRQQEEYKKNYESMYDHE